MLQLSDEIMTERLRIRVLQPSFVNARKLLDYVQQNQTHFYFMYGFVEYTRPEQMYDFLQRRKSNNNPYYGVFLKTSDELIGCVSANGFNEKCGSIEIGYSLDEDFQHQGFITEAVSAWCEELIAKGCRKLTATVDVANENSQKVCDRCGFIREARLIKEKLNRHTGDFDDVFIYCRFKEIS